VAVDASGVERDGSGDTALKYKDVGTLECGQVKLFPQASQE
jgi:hypothetical protein